MQIIVMSINCLFGCLTVDLLGLNFTKVFMHDVACGRDSVLLWRRCHTLCTSGFMDEVMLLGPLSTYDRLYPWTRSLDRFKL